MVDLQTISVVIMAVSFVLGIITWLSQKRERKEIQQTRLFMQSYLETSTAELQTLAFNIMDWG